MNTNLNSKDIQLNEQRRQYAEAEAIRYRLGREAAQPRSSASYHLHLPVPARLLLAVSLLFSFLILMTHVTLARDTADTGEGEAFSDAILSYRLGHYHFVTGDYDKAVAEYTTAIAAIPERVFEQHLDYAVMYWDLGDAQFKAGQDDQALNSYQHYLYLAGDKASVQAVAYVQQFQNAISDDTVGDMTVMNG